MNEKTKENLTFSNASKKRAFPIERAISACMQRTRQSLNTFALIRAHLSLPSVPIEVCMSSAENNNAVPHESKSK